MPGKILGISASPQKGGKVETVLQEILRSSRLAPELVRLHEIRVGPCRAFNACRRENKCIVEDDWPDLQKKIIASNAVVIGGWAFSGMIDSATKALVERFWSFRHHRQLTRGKVGAAVVVGNNPELAGNLADALLQFMRNNGMNPLGRVTAAGANPCLGCPDSLEACEYSNVVAAYGMLERIGKGMYNPIENQLAVLKSARILGERVGHKVEHMMARGFGKDN
jgi:multimeric flavodoxin WrbA